MKKLILGLLMNFIIVYSLYSMAGSADPYAAPVVSPILSFLPLFFLGIFILLGFAEFKIGKIIGYKVNQETGLILGIILIVLFPFLIMGISVIVYSNKKKSDVNLNNGFDKFIGKNYKDILTENNLSEYIDKFTENKLTEINIISELTDSDFEKIGIKIMGDRKKILKIFSVK
jgi:hypothetical protein